MTTITKLPEWQSLQDAYKTIKKQSLEQLFQADSQRFTHYSRIYEQLLFDFSKTHIDKSVLEKLLTLAKACDLSAQFKAMLKGDIVNRTEKRSALHTALRRPLDKPLLLNDHDIMQDIGLTLEKMRDFCSKIQSGTLRGYTGDRFTDIVNIGIGGSDLGPQFIVDALKPQELAHLKLHFVSNIDCQQIHDVLKQCHPNSTLFIISSKTFSTQETIANFRIAKNWLNHGFQTETAFHKHFVAVTSNSLAAINHGFDAQTIFPIWDFVGGRYSLWSAVGLPIALAIGMDKFQELLLGAQHMDLHAENTEISDNIPFLKALIDTWYINFFNAPTRAIIPYSHALRLMPSYLQQAEMESNGKSVSQTGEIINYDTAPIIWGGTGTNSQHSFHQLLHQGTHLIPIDFIVSAKIQHEHQVEQDLFLANMLAQARALAFGQTEQESYQQLLNQNIPTDEAKLLARHRACPGNKPSVTIALSAINPYNLGLLLALYEHKIAAQSIIWQINAFDQFGVELGKTLANEIASAISLGNYPAGLDSSTLGLIHFLKK